jgi:tRNA (cmo5U34)-methyltransferase
VPPEEWTTAEHALRYLARADAYPRRAEGEGALLEQVPGDARRVLDLGTGDGRLLGLLLGDRPGMVGVGLDFSEPMLQAARKRFADDDRIELLKHDLAGLCPAKPSGASTR